MPVIGIPVKMLLERIESALARDELIEHLQHLGCDVEGYATLRRFRCDLCDNILEITTTENPPVECDRCGADFRQAQRSSLVELGESDVIRMELLAVRPDMFDPGGLARVLRHYLGEQAQPARYELAPPRFSVEVAPQLAEPTSYRPAIACAVVRELRLDDDTIKVLMKLQENLHWALGRDRKHASIGVYDLDTVAGPGLRYRAVSPDELRFAPLGHAASDELTPCEILEQHPKGRAYARLLAGFERYPLLADAGGNVLSMPPIINSEPTRVTRETTSFLIDVTGSEQRIVNKALNIIATSLAELDRAAQLEQVRVVYPDGEKVTPDLTPQAAELTAAAAARTIGVDLDGEALGGLLRRMGHGVDLAGDRVRVAVPAYRNDIMHPVDLIEDAAIAYGYHRIVPTLVPTLTVGSEQPLERTSGVCRRAMAGLGYLEVMTLILSSEARQYQALRLPERAERVRIDNPISVEQTMIRTSLLPGLLDTFSVNIDHEMPQRIFEVGNISSVDTAAEVGASERRLVGAASCGPKADFAEIRSACGALLHELGWQLETEATDLPCYIAGRGARVLALRGAERHDVGTVGEIHPEVLESFKLVQPVAAFEVDLHRLAGAW